MDLHPSAGPIAARLPPSMSCCHMGSCLLTDEVLLPCQINSVGAVATPVTCSVTA